ncbi:MAG: signal peptidase I [Nitrososphaera sp.]
MGFSELMHQLSDPKYKTRLTFMIMISVGLTAGVGVYTLVIVASHSFRFFIATTSSMEPSIYPGDLIVADPNYPFHSLKVGDVIVFSAPNGADIISHRIVQVTHIDFWRPSGTSRSVPVLVAKGDANSHPIYGLDFPISQQNYIAKSVVVIRGGGDILNWLAPRQMMTSP